MSGKQLLVMKFGGTSVGYAGGFLQCAQIVRDVAAHDCVVVVVSAVAGVTDLIFRTIDAARRGDTLTTETNLKQFEGIHQRLIAELFEANSSQRAAVLKLTGQVVEQLRSSSQALLALRSDVSARTYDLLTALGERISASLLAACIQQLGTTSEVVGSENVIITDDNFGNAAPDSEATTAACLSMLVPILECGAVPVVSGYSGATREGEPTTLGRGGSDYSATIIGAAMGADEVWIWTDVDGVLSADPRICPDAVTLPEISFAEALELAYFGAKVIHPRAGCPSMNAGFALWIKNSFRPRAIGSRITHAGAPSNALVKAVTSENRATLITLMTGREAHSAELFGRLFLRLGQEGIDALFTTQSSPDHALGLVLRKADGQRVIALVHKIFRIELAQGILKPVAVQDDIAVIAVLGNSMKGNPGILARIFSAVARQTANIIAVAQGASGLSVCFAVPSPKCADVVREVHDEFFLSGRTAARACVWPKMAVESVSAIEAISPCPKGFRNGSHGGATCCDDLESEEIMRKW